MESIIGRIIEDNDQTGARHAHLNAITEIVGNAYPNKFERSHVTGDEDTISAIINNENITSHVPQLSEDAKPTPEQLIAANAELNKINVRVSGRIATPPRVMGKAAFVHLSDGALRLQIYVRKADAKAISNKDGAPINDTEAGWKLFALLDHGDFIGVSGYLFVTKTGELSIHVQTLQFLAKALLPMPDKMHGIADAEIRRRQRYVDLIAGSLKVDTEQEKSEESKSEDSKKEKELTPREVFERRSRIISAMRRYLDEHGYIEVETPMLTPKATGAVARAFETHHNALDIKLYARIAPELYLKRLLVGGFERVYELNRNFRNEGIDATHNPEFTMLEFYCAYMDVTGMMDFCEAMIRENVLKATGGTKVKFGDEEIDFDRKFARSTMKQSIVYLQNKSFLLEKSIIALSGGIDENKLNDFDYLFSLNQFIFKISDFTQRIYGRSAIDILKGNKPPSGEKEIEEWLSVRQESNNEAAKESFDMSAEQKESLKGLCLGNIFSYVAEPYLTQPTFIIDFPKSVSPLSKASPQNPQIAERFELFIAGMECANGFSELNDPQEQYERFADQMKERERGDDEAMQMDEDYIRALAYGMPPAAGIGIGVDRLVMLLTNRHSIRDVILFPHMRPEKSKDEGGRRKDE